jgi:hypothetical protein
VKKRRAEYRRQMESHHIKMDTNLLQTADCTYEECMFDLSAGEDNAAGTVCSSGTRRCHAVDDNTIRGHRGTTLRQSDLTRTFRTRVNAGWSCRLQGSTRTDSDQDAGRWRRSQYRVLVARSPAVPLESTEMDGIKLIIGFRAVSHSNRFV